MRLFISHADISNTNASELRLLSTLGNKTHYKKISKREIQSVSIPQTCDVIKNPPRPMALRLTSNLLYGVALIYKQKTDYLNNDASLIKTKIQRDLFSQSNTGDGKVLIKTPNYIIQPVDLTRTQQGGNNQSQGTVLLNDDPGFNIQGDLLPSLDELDFLENGSTQLKVNDYRNQLRRADLENNTVSVVLSTITNSTEEDVFSRRVVNHDDILDTENPEFAFDEEGMLLNLHDDDTTNQPGPAPPSDAGDNFDLDFDFDLDVPETVVAQANNNDLDQILEEVEDQPEVPPVSEEPEIPVVTPKRRKRKTKEQFNKIIIDETISLQTNDLRGFRDNYVTHMISQAKKPKRTNLINVQDLISESSFLPNFTVPLDQELRGRKPNSHEDDEDFVDGLLRNTRRSSESIEVRRNTSSTRRHSRASLSSINLPLEGLEGRQHDDTTGNNDGFDFDFDFDVDLDRMDEHPSRKRSSSSVQRFPALEEGNEDDRVEEGAAMRNVEIDKRTVKFMTFIENRFDDEAKDEMNFEELMQFQQDRSIVVKSFYEVLQLATLNSIHIKASSKVDLFELSNARDFLVRLI